MADKDDKIHSKNSDQKLWESYMQDIKPLENKKVRNVQETIDKKKKPKEPRQETTPSVRHDRRKEKQVFQAADRRTQEKLRRGQFKIEGRLDLHGKSREQAYDTLQGFIRSSFDGGKKCVLVITGKGGWQNADDLLMDKKQGVLRQSLPSWLSDPVFTPYVLSWQSAKPKDGGDGAFYVLLRRKK